MNWSLKNYIAHPLDQLKISSGRRLPIGLIIWNIYLLKVTLIENPTVKGYYIIFYLVMAEGQAMAAYILLYKCLKEGLVKKCNVYVALSST